MKDDNKHISIRKIIIIVFMAVMLITISIICYLVFFNWFLSAKQTTENIVEEMNINISNKVNSLLNTPEQINKSNHKIVENGILDMYNETQRNKFFAGVLSSYDEEIYSFSFGAENGEYYGARRNNDGIIEIMKNNAETGGNSWYYSVNEDLTAGELSASAGKFDPRIRAWYKKAIEADAPTFSPIYKHFVMNDLTISYACPVYSKDGTLRGVLGTHMLLNDIGTYLKDAVNQYNGYAIIFEKGTKELIANSMELKNFEVLQDGTLKRFDINGIQNDDIQNAYEQYNLNDKSNFIFKGKEQNFYIHAEEISLEGLEWVVLSAIPEDYLISPIIQSIYLTAIFTVLLLLLSFIIYTVITERLLSPMNSLLIIADALSAGDLTKRVNISRNDEVGGISESFNKVADKMQLLVNHFEATVQERTEELYKVNEELEESKNQLQLILDSTAEAIYGVDLTGKCTFCNMSCIKMLGYNSQEDLLGKDMHDQIHHSHKDGINHPKKDCKIYQSIYSGVGFMSYDEVFWRADGTCFDVEYHSYPQIKEGKIVGGVVTFMDITERNRKEEEIRYLSCHDALTGLYNRRYFEDMREVVDKPENLPLTVVFADINGLKMTNDIFGHAAGDELIKKSSKILKQFCSQDDIIARIGGDEFIILMPKTTEENAIKILSQIKYEFSNARIEAVKCSISAGFNTKRSPHESLDEIIFNAENAMYKDKTMNRKSINIDIIDTIIETLHSRSLREKKHSVAVGELSFEIGRKLNLPETETSKLNRAGYLHDIGKIVLSDSILKKDSLTEEEFEKMKQHSVVGYRILNLFDDTLDLAEYIYGHHERWDGGGYPRGLKGEQIPLISRIISVAEAYDRIASKDDLPPEEREAAAIEIIKNGAGTQFDPQIAELFVQMKQQK